MPLGAAGREWQTLEARDQYPMPKTATGGRAQAGNAEQLSADISALNVAPSYDVRQGSNFIDEEGALEIPVSSGSEDEDEEEPSEEDEQQSSGYDSQLEAAAWDESMNRVDDEDWEIAEGGMFLSLFLLPSFPLKPIRKRLHQIL